MFGVALFTNGNENDLLGADLNVEHISLPAEVTAFIVFMNQHENKSVVKVVTFADCDANGPEKEFGIMFVENGVLAPVLMTDMNGQF